MPTQTDPLQADSAPKSSADSAGLLLARRSLILRDTFTFLSLAAVTVLLFMVTLLLFRSFAGHRAELAQRWAARGKAALDAGQPSQAIVALRTALAYAPGQQADELLLAQALGDAGHTEESYNYFLGLWDAEPGSGFINLQLARLAARKREQQSAVHYFRAAIYGTWEGDGVLRRREARLELARYLIAQKDFANARTELLIAGGNASADPALYVTIAGLLEQANAPADALVYYQKAIASKPNNPVALEAAGRLAYSLGDYAKAHRLIERALRERATTAFDTPASRAEMEKLADDSEEMQLIEPSPRLPAAERVSRILYLRSLAKKRLAACSAQLSTPGAWPAALQALNAEWIAPAASLGRPALLGDTSLQDATIQLVYSTEIQISEVCPAPLGNDALVLALAKSLPANAQ